MAPNVGETPTGSEVWFPLLSLVLFAGAKSKGFLYYLNMILFESLPLIHLL
jgi:hypothetical protein